MVQADNLVDYLEDPVYLLEVAPPRSRERDAVLQAAWQSTGGRYTEVVRTGEKSDS